MSYDRGDVTGFSPGTTYIAPGVTNAILHSDPHYTNGGLIKYISGGSLLIMRAPGVMQNNTYGGTYAAATLVNNYNLGRYWLMDAAPLAYDGAARYYLAAIGATVTVQIIRGLDAGYTESSQIYT